MNIIIINDIPDVINQVVKLVMNEGIYNFECIGSGSSGDVFYYEGCAVKVFNIYGNDKKDGEILAKKHDEGSVPVQDRIKIVLGEISVFDIFALYESSLMYLDTKDSYNIGHKSTLALNFHTEEYNKLINKQSKFQKLINLFAYSAITNNRFKNMKDWLSQYGYNLKLEYIPSKKITVPVNRIPYNGCYVDEVVLDYDVRIVVE